VPNKNKRQGDARIATHVVDAASLSLAWLIVFVITNITITAARSNSQSLVLAAIAVVATIGFFHRYGLYQTRPTLPRTDEISRLVGAILTGGAATIVSGAFLNWHIGAWEIVIGFAIAVSLLVVARGMIRSLGAELQSRHVPERVVIVGSGHEAGDLAEVIADHPEARFDLVGIVGHLPVAEKFGLADLWLGPTDRLVELMHVHEAQSAIVTPTGFRGEQFRNITRDLFDAGFDVHLSTGVSRLWDARFEVRSLAHEPLVVWSANEPARWQLATKRAIDIIGAVVGLILVAPILLLTAMAIKVEDGGPALFRQRRAGRGAKTFEMVKFRSMVTNAEELKADLANENQRSGPLFKLSDDPRITRVGRLIRESSIDELPQLVNVLKGEMSLVGPRPALLEEEAAFDDELRGRFSVRPGITGLWQVEARSNASFSAYRRLDLHYVENWTVGLDLRILMATVEQVIVTVAMLPLRRFLPANGNDQVVVAQSETIIDLREKTTARLAAAHTARTGGHSASAPGDESSSSGAG